MKRENEMQTEELSLQAKKVIKAVEFANHMPGLGHMVQSGEFRRRLTAVEPHWNVPEGLTLTVEELSHCRMEWLYSEEEAGKKILILQIHGGGYYGKLHNTYRDMAALYNKLSGGVVVSLDYRVAPQNPYPAAFADAIEAYQNILARGYSGNDIIVAGDSAGGGLALALVMYLRDQGMPLPAGVITMSAWTDLTLSGDSYTENFNTDPMFGGSTDTLVYHNEYPRGHDPRDPYISPIFGDFKNFPPMLMQVGEREMLLSDTLEVARKAKVSGVRVEEQIFPGMFHVFQMGLSRFPESVHAWKEVRRFIRGIFSDGDRSVKTEVLETKAMDREVMETKAMDREVMETKVRETKIMDREVMETKVMDREVMETKAMDREVMETKVMDRQDMVKKVMDRDAALELEGEVIESGENN